MTFIVYSKILISFIFFFLLMAIVDIGILTILIYIGIFLYCIFFIRNYYFCLFGGRCYYTQRFFFNIYFSTIFFILQSKEDAEIMLLYLGECIKKNKLADQNLQFLSLKSLDSANVPLDGISMAMLNKITVLCNPRYYEVHDDIISITIKHHIFTKTGRTIAIKGIKDLQYFNSLPEEKQNLVYSDMTPIDFYKLAENRKILYSSMPDLHGLDLFVYLS